MKVLSAVAALLALTASHAFATATFSEAARPDAKTVQAKALAICGRFWASDPTPNGYYCDEVTLTFTLRGECPASVFTKIVVWSERGLIEGEANVGADGTATVTLIGFRIENPRTRVIWWGAELAEGATAHTGKSFGFGITGVAMNAPRIFSAPIPGTDNTVGAGISNATVGITPLAAPMGSMVALGYAQQPLGSFRLESAGDKLLYTDGAFMRVEFDPGTPITAITNLTIVNDLGERVSGNNASEPDPQGGHAVVLSFSTKMTIFGGSTNLHVRGDLASPVAGMKFKLVLITQNLRVKDVNDSQRVLFAPEQARIECTLQTVTDEASPQTILVQRPLGWYVRGLGPVGQSLKIQWATSPTGPWYDLKSFVGDSGDTPVLSMPLRFFKTVAQ